VEVNEKELHRRAIVGDDDAFLAVMQLYKEPLLRTALAFLRNENDAIEALQEVTHRAYKKIWTVKEPNYLKTWLIRIMMNYCQDQLKLRKQFTVDASGLETESAEDISYLEMREALATLSNEEQRLIYLKYFLESKIKDIAQSENIPEGSFSYGNVMDEGENYTYKDRIDYQFGELYTSRNQSFDLKVAVKLKGEETVFSVPFTVPEQIKPSEVYTIDKEVDIKGQKFVIEKVTVSPLRVGVKVSIDPDNTMKILQFEDMRLEDEKGEVWGSIRNGTTASGGEDGKYTFFLQSNYFSKPEKLYLRMNKVQALQAEEAFAEVNTETEEWINQPEDQRIQLLQSNKHHAEFIMKNTGDEEFPFFFIGSAVDANGIEVETPSTGRYSDGEATHWDVNFDRTDYMNPLKLELFAYPNYLEGDIKIELK